MPRSAINPEPSHDDAAIGWLSSPQVRYPDAYLLFVLVSSMDIMLTWRILADGGWEVNPIARLVIDTWGLGGAIAFKYSLTLFVIVTCEVTGRQRDRVGRLLARVAVVISSVPVVYSIALLLFTLTTSWSPVEIIEPPSPGAMEMLRPN